MLNPPTFTPLNGATNYSITVGAASVNVQVASFSGSAQAALSLLNFGTAATFFRLGNSNGVTAVATDAVLGPNERLIVPIPPDYMSGINAQLWVAAIGAVGPVLYITVGTFN
jgi:hypothetical protein